MENVRYVLGFTLFLIFVRPRERNENKKRDLRNEAPGVAGYIEIVRLVPSRSKMSQSRLSDLFPRAYIPLSSRAISYLRAYGIPLSRTFVL